MDIARTGVQRRKWLRRSIYLGLTAVLVTAGMVAVWRLQPADPVVDRSLTVIETVKRGLMLREVHGSGSLVPQEILWLAASTDALVEKPPLLPGIAVKPDTVLIELANPDLESAAVNAQWAQKSAEAQLTSDRARLRNEQLDLEAKIAREQADQREADLQKIVDDKLFKDDLISESELKLAASKSQMQGQLIEIDMRQLDIKKQSMEAQLAVQEAAVEQAKAQCQLKRQQLQSLKVCAGIEGVLEEVKVEVGQRVAAGTVLARVTNPHRLKAALKIAETEARDLVLGQAAQIDTRNSLVKGHVMRIDPGSSEGTVTVDVEFDEPLPKEARPDLSVDGTIQLERLENVMYVGRPVYGQAESTITLFKLMPDGTAMRVPVKLGRSSVTTVEVVDGLSEGDLVILSDVREWDKFDKIRLR